MRIFVAIEITNNHIINSIKEFQKNVNIDAKPTELKNLHFTLQFLGEVSEEITQKIIQSLNTIKFSSFDVNLKGIGVFPNPKFSRVVWIGTDEVGENMLIQLSKKVEKVLEPLDFFQINRSNLISQYLELKRRLEIYQENWKIIK